MSTETQCNSLTFRLKRRMAQVYLALFCGACMRTSSFAVAASPCMPLHVVPCMLYLHRLRGLCCSLLHSITTALPGGFDRRARDQREKLHNDIGTLEIRLMCLQVVMRRVAQEYLVRLIAGTVYHVHWLVKRFVRDRKRAAPCV